MTEITAPLDVGCPSGLAPPSGDASSGGLSAFVRRKGEINQLNLSIRGAKCGGCIAKIEAATSALPGVETVRLNLSTGRFEITWRGELSPDRIGETITSLGYGVSAFGEDNTSREAKREERSLLIAMGIAGFAMANIMLLSVSVWGGHDEMGDTTRQTMHAISGLIALPVIMFSGRHFFRSAWNVLRHGHANMDVPISLALILAFSVSVWETLQGGPHAYFDACIMLLFFLLIGRFLDARLRRQAHAAAHDLAAMQNKSVSRFTSAGHTVAIRAEDVREGDLILLAPGERAVIDMQITEGQSEIDESLTTGETLPRLVSSGAALFAGTVNLGAPLKGIALGEAANSLLADIARMLEAGEQRRSTYRKIADRAVALYVPFVHTTAALAFIAWLLLGAAIGDAVMIAVTTLIITCPCALALAAPIVQVVAAGRLFKRGVFLKSGDALERLAEIDHVVFDKTGTLTLGEPVLIQQLAPTNSSPAPLDIAARLSRASRHPLSRAIVTAAGAGRVADNVREYPGLGLEGEVNGDICRLGSAEWVGIDTPAPATGPTLWLAIGEAEPIQFNFSDEPRAEALSAIDDLKAAGLDVEILSGDAPGAVSAIAERLKIDTWSAEAKPAGKVARLESLGAAGKRVMMVGDGLNDAGALALAHASLAPGGAMDISQSASDAVYSGGLASIPQILRLSRRAKQVMQQNFALAAAYNLIAVPIAVTGNVTPLIAAIAMSASSLLVTLNALRIGFDHKVSPS